jgi:hypothetical protein
MLDLVKVFINWRLQLKVHGGHTCGGHDHPRHKDANNTSSSVDASQVNVNTS